MTTVLVTGAGGFVGRHLVPLLERRGHAVVAIDRRWDSVGTLKAQLAGRSIDSTVHLGWYASAPDYRTNERENERSCTAGAELADLLLEVCERPHLVVAGTWADVAPQDAYGRWKRRLHDHLAARVVPLGVRLAWARLYNVVGPGEAPARFGPAIASAVAHGRPFEMTSGVQVRDYVDVTDAAGALAMLATSGAVGEYDVGTGIGTPVASFARAVARAAGDERLLAVGARPSDAGEVPAAVADPAALVALGWRPRFDVDAMAARVVVSSLEGDASDGL